MGNHILLHGLASAAYLALGLYFWRSRWRTTQPAEPKNWERTALAFPFGLHTFLLWQDLFVLTPLHFGFSQALSVTLWLGVLIYWFESLMVNLQGMQAFILPLAAVSVFLPAVFPGREIPLYENGAIFRAHLALAMAAYSLFTIAALHALLMALLERSLHVAKAPRDGAGLLRGALAQMPPLLTLEALLFRVLALGFALLTLTLATGFIFSEELFSKPMSFTHKTVFAMLSWLIFAALLLGRYRYGWRGRRALRWTLAGFSCLLLAYVGSRFVLEVLLGRV